MTVDSDEKKVKRHHLADQLVVIFNPAAGGRRRKRMADLLRTMRKQRLRPRFAATRAPGDAADLANQSSNSHPNMVTAVAGGDGTVNEAVNGMLAGKGHGKPPVMAVIPFGTVNLLANELNLPNANHDLARMLINHETVQITPALVNERLFLVTAGVGFDARVVKRVTQSMKRRWGRLAYVLASMSELWHGDPPTLTVKACGREFECNGVLVAKGKYYAGRMQWAPDATVTQPSLFVGMIQSRRRWQVISAALALALGRAHHWPGIKVFRADSFTVDGPSREPIQADGDIVGRLPATFSVSNQSISVISPI